MTHPAENDAPCPVPHCQCAHVAAHARITSRVCPNCGHDLMVQSREARAWLAGWHAGYDDYDQGTDTPNPFRVIPPVGQPAENDSPTSRPIVWCGSCFRALGGQCSACRTEADRYVIPPAVPAENDASRCGYRCTERGCGRRCVLTTAHAGHVHPCERHAPIPPGQNPYRDRA